MDFINVAVKGAAWLAITVVSLRDFPHGLLQDRSRNRRYTTDCLRDPGEGIVKWGNFIRPLC